MDRLVPYGCRGTDLGKLDTLWSPGGGTDATSYFVALRASRTGRQGRRVLQSVAM